MKHAAVFCLTFLVSMSMVRAQTPLSTENWMERGIQAYNFSRYAEAQTSFEQATGLEPKNVSAHLYLGNTHMTQWVPGIATPDNQKHHQRAKEEFLQVLDIEPDNSLALTALASLAYNSATFGNPEKRQAALEEARKWNQRCVQVDANNAEAYYYLGVLSWSECFLKIQAQRIAAHLPPEELGPLPEGVPKQQLKKTCLPKIEEGLSDLRRALELEPEHDDAMSYVNLMYRSRAYLADSSSEAHSYVEEAERWMERALEVKRKKASQHPSGN